MTREAAVRLRQGDMVKHAKTGELLYVFSVEQVFFSSAVWVQCYNEAGKRLAFHYHDLESIDGRSL